VGSRIRILLAEDHATVREGLRLLIDGQPDMEVVAQASDGSEVAAQAKAASPDVVVVDVSMPGTSGLVATRELKREQPGIRIIALTRHTEVSYLQEFLRAGVSGYVLKQSPHGELLQAIRAAMSGRQHIDSTLTRYLAGPFVSADVRKGTRAIPAISGRESEVLRLSAQGHANKDIAAQLNVSVKTVEVHKANGMRKLRLGRRTELLQFAVVQGWLAEG
jgi:DNA-binding NarL/FixJ family response regulator